jgi:hypothetical protein
MKKIALTSISILVIVVIFALTGCNGATTTVTTTATVTAPPVTTTVTTTIATTLPAALAEVFTGWEKNTVVDGVQISSVMVLLKGRVISINGRQVTLEAQNGDRFIIMLYENVPSDQMDLLNLRLKDGGRVTIEGSRSLEDGSQIGYHIYDGDVTPSWYQPVPR